MQKKHILIFILAFFFFLQTLPVFAQGVQCDSCGTSITYSNFGAKTEKGDYLCKDCYRQQQEHPQQQEQPKQKQTQSQQVQLKQTKQQAQGAQCDSCGTSITYSNFGSKIKTGYLCKNCYHKQQEHLQQQKQTQNQQVQTQKQVQQKQRTKKQEDRKQCICAVCNNSIEAGTKYYFSADRQPICFNCLDKCKDSCRTCGLPILPNGGVRTGSWIVCTPCSKDIIVTDSQLKECYAEACKFMNEHLGLNVPVPVENVYFSDISEMGDGHDGNFNGYAIRFQKGMSKLDTIRVLIHESAHAWMRQLENRMYSEGFAEWCSYKYFMNIGEIQYFNNHRPPRHENNYYSAGLRKMLELEKKMTQKGLLEYVKTHNDFPKE